MAGHYNILNSDVGQPSTSPASTAAYGQDLTIWVGLYTGPFLHQGKSQCKVFEVLVVQTPKSLMVFAQAHRGEDSARAFARALTLGS
jgi:hypothetical protein